MRWSPDEAHSPGVRDAPEGLRFRGVHTRPNARAPAHTHAQMAYLARRGDVHAVVTEDSDLLAYACPRWGARAAAAQQWRSASAAAPQFPRMQ